MNISSDPATRRQNWRTPQWLYRELDREFKFDFDPCLSDPEFNGLEISWGKSNFVNPPFNDLKRWLTKAYIEALDGNTSVVLMPSRTDTAYWYDIVIPHAEIRWIRGRIDFIHKDKSVSRSPFPCCLAIFRPPKHTPLRIKILTILTSIFPCFKKKFDK